MQLKDKKNKNFEVGIKKLTSWLKNKNWNIIFGNKLEDEMFPVEKYITINNKFKIENQLYACLHECGHLLLHENRNYKNVYPNAYEMDNKIKSKSKKKIKPYKYKVDVVSEEIDAWRKGKELAKKLKISINEQNYYDEMTKYVFTYIKSASTI